MAVRATPRALDPQVVTDDAVDDPSSDCVVAPQRWKVAGVTSAVVVALARWWTSAGRSEFSIWPDEPAQLAIARLMGGGTRWTMHDHSTWRPGYGTLLSPVHWVTDDPTLVFRTALALNAVLGGIAAWLLVVLTRRLTSMGPAACAFVAIVISMSPAILLQTDFVWSESLILPLHLATLLALLRLQAAPTLHSSLIAATLATAAFATHSRLLILSIVTVGVVVFAAHRRRLPRRDAAIAVVAIGFGVLLVEAFSTWVVDRLWNEPAATNSIGGVIGQATDVGAVLISLAGQSWYLIVSSAGIVGIGGLAALRTARRRDDQLPEQSRPRRDDARVVLIVVASSVALSVVFMAGRLRTDRVLYGRYNDAAVTPLLIIGIAVLIGAFGRTWDRRPTIRRRVTAPAITATTLAVCAGVLLVFRREPLSESNGLEPMILGLQPFVGDDSSIAVVRLTAIALAFMAGVVTMSLVMRRVTSGRTRVLATLAPLLVLALIGAVRTSTILDRDWDGRGDYRDVGQLRDGDGVLADGARADYVLPAGSDSTNRLMLYQMYLPQTEIAVIADPVAGATSPFVFAPVQSDALDRSGAVLVWTDPHGGWGLWERSAAA